MSNTRPQVSVVMSVYNGEHHLASAIDSVLNQTFRDFEFIIVNDGSRDRTAEILTHYSRRDQRIVVHEQENSGLTDALSRGCELARGDIIARQDADDWSHPQRFDRCVALLKRDGGLAMVACWTRYIDDQGDVVETVERPGDSIEATHALLRLGQGPGAHGSVMFRRTDYEAVGGYRGCFYFGQDSDLWLRLATRGRLGYVSDYLYDARLNTTGISAVHRAVQWEFGDLGRECQAAREAGLDEGPILVRAAALREAFLFSRRGSPTHRQQAAANYRIGTSLGRRGNARAREYFWKAVRADPFHWRSWCRLGQECVRFRRSDSTGD